MEFSIVIDDKLITVSQLDTVEDDGIYYDEDGVAYWFDEEAEVEYYYDEEADDWFEVEEEADEE